MIFFPRAIIISVLISSPVFAISEFWRNLINPLPTQYSSEAKRNLCWFGNDEVNLLRIQIRDLLLRKNVAPAVQKEFEKNFPEANGLNIEPMIKDIDEQIKINSEKMGEIISNNSKNSWLVTISKYPNVFKYGTYALVALSYWATFIVYKQGWFNKAWNKVQHFFGSKKENK